MNKACRKYLRQVARAMGCPRADRDRLLSGFRHELEEAFPAGTAPALDELTARFGTPRALADELMTALPEGTAAKYEASRRKKWRTAAVAGAVVIALLIGYLAWLASIDVYVPPQDVEITYTDEYIEGH